jgi:hypothetical protein
MRARTLIAALGFACSCGVASEPSSSGGVGPSGARGGFSAGQPSTTPSPSASPGTNEEFPPPGVSAEPGFGVDGGVEVCDCPSGLCCGALCCNQGDLCCEQNGALACIPPQGIGRDCFDFGLTFPP